MVFFELIQRFECCVANFADKNIAVTNGMKKWLDINNQKQNTIVYHDYALAEFHQRTIKEMYEVFNLVFSDKFQEFRERYNPIIIKEADSLIEEKERTLSYAKQRPVVGISATSWTSDEDFDLFLLAIIKCEDKIMKLSPSKFAKFPTVYIFITGRGPLRKIFEEKLKNHILKIFKISTCWLSRENYIKLLGSVDFGISLHTSTSKIDFPMKIIEMLASGLPVLSYDYECAHEIIKNEKNGIFFANDHELSEKLYELLYDFEKNKQYKNMKEFIKNQPYISAKKKWNEIVLPLIQ